MGCDRFFERQPNVSGLRSFHLVWAPACNGANRPTEDAVIPFLLLLLACQPEPEPEPNFAEAFASIDASLNEAGRLHVASQTEDARASWRRAHTEFEDVVEPHLRSSMPANDVAELELRFGLFRSALESRQGSARASLRQLKVALDDAEATLVSPEEIEPLPDGVPIDAAAVRTPDGAQ